MSFMIKLWDCEYHPWKLVKISIQQLTNCLDIDKKFLNSISAQIPGFQNTGPDISSRIPILVRKRLVCQTKLRSVVLYYSTNSTANYVVRVEGCKQNTKS
jgi:hypothetical protein